MKCYISCHGFLHFSFAVSEEKKSNFFQILSESDDRTAFTNEDKDMIKHYRQHKGHSVNQLLKEFPHKNWKKEGLRKLVNKIGSTGCVDLASSSEG